MHTFSSRDPSSPGRYNARQLKVDIQLPCSPAAGPLSTPESPGRRHNERSCSLRSCSHVKPVRWVQVVAQPHQLPLTCRVARKNWSQEVQLRECAGGAHSGGPPIRSASEALISTASTIVMLPPLTIRRARLARVCSSSMVAVGPSGVHPCLGAGMALQHPRPSSLHCRCGMAEDRPHATEPCPRSSGQAHGQQACPQMRLTGKRPLCRRFNSTTRGPT